MLSSLKKQIHKSCILKKLLLRNSNEIKSIIDMMIDCLTKGGKIFLCGNGGSAADAQHLAAEFLVRLKKKNIRKPLPAISLALDTSTLTACANDFGYKYVFQRNLEALADFKKDILLVITTSGNSENLKQVLKLAKKKSMVAIGFLGGSGGECKKYCNKKIIISSNETARVQETHIFLGHFIFGEVEKFFLKKK